ncbi:MAG: hypothetical protein K0R83_2596 [Caulobacter sp.]|jgi:hypothetical protein|nr:hypothetical protein [Caulobacter sp.]
MDAYEANFLVSIALVYFWPVVLLLVILAFVVVFSLTLASHGLAKRWLTARWAAVIAAGVFLAFALPIALLVADIAHRFKTGTLS